MRKWDTAFAVRQGRWADVSLRDLYPFFADRRSRGAVVELIASSFEQRELVAEFPQGGEFFDFLVVLTAAIAQRAQARTITVAYPYHAEPAPNPAMPLTPQPDGSHDDLDPGHVNPRVVELLTTSLRPYIEALPPDEARAQIRQFAEGMEDVLRITDPGNPLLAWLDRERAAHQRPGSGPPDAQG